MNSIQIQLKIWFKYSPGGQFSPVWMEPALPPGTVPGEQPGLAGVAGPQTLTLDPIHVLFVLDLLLPQELLLLGHTLTSARLLQVNVLYKVLPERCPARLLDVQENHDVGGARVELPAPPDDIPVVDEFAGRRRQRVRHVRPAELALQVCCGEGGYGGSNLMPGTDVITVGIGQICEEH